MLPFDPPRTASLLITSRSCLGRPVTAFFKPRVRGITAIRSRHHRKRGLSGNENACALISMMARSKSSNQRPDTLMQDRLPPDRRKPLATRGRTIHWVIRDQVEPSSKSGHVRYAPIATKFRSAAKCRDAPVSEIAVSFDNLVGAGQRRPELSPIFDLDQTGACKWNFNRNSSVEPRGCNRPGQRIK